MLYYTMKYFLWLHSIQILLLLFLKCICCSSYADQVNSGWLMVFRQKLSVSLSPPDSSHTIAPVCLPLGSIPQHSSKEPGEVRKGSLSLILVALGRRHHQSWWNPRTQPTKGADPCQQVDNHSKEKLSTLC